MKISELLEDAEAKIVIERAVKDAKDRIGNLTNAQRAILPLICDGVLNKQAAHALGISQRTIENHRLEIMRRTGCKTVPQLVKLQILAG